MKKTLLLIPAFAFILASCASDEPIGKDNPPEYAAVSSYLNINLVPSSGMGFMGSRAEDNPYDKGDGTYQDGDPKENNVTRVRFYFFNGDGVPFAVRQNLTTEEWDNFVDWYPNSTEVGGPDHDATVEKTLNATLGLTFSDNQKRPSKVLAVANPTNEVLYYSKEGGYPNMSSNSMSLQDLQKVVADYLPYADNNFVMSNSVYVATINGNKEIVYTTALDGTNFQPTPMEAAKNAVSIYIERVLARVDFGINMTPAKLEGVDGTYYSVGTYTLNDGADGSENQEDEAIYVKFLGWNVTSTTGTSRLIKEVNEDWTDKQIMGGNSSNTGLLWNTVDYHRSFWALNPAGVQIQLGNFGPVEGDEFKDLNPEGQYANSLDIPGEDEFVTTYLQENANPASTDDTPPAAAAPSEPSKVIIAAQLVDAQGDPLTICEWGYNKYTLQGLKNQLAKALPNLYFQTEDGWSQIEADMITFTTTDPLGTNDDGEAYDKEYYVYAVLDNNETAGLTWALKSGDTFEPFTSQEGEPSVTDQVDLYIRGIVNHAMIWNSGLTYYYFDIRHLGESSQDAGYVGIVRNHLYRATVTSLKGLGTPVYDPDQVIHPQVTNPGETVIAAKINILSWRLVSNDYELDWE